MLCTKLERLFGQSRSIESDVRTTGRVRVHGDATEGSDVERAVGS